MLELRYPPPVKIMAGIFWNNKTSRATAIRLLEQKWGPPDFASEPAPFTYSNYYASEMGTDLIRQVFSFPTLAQPEHLADYKHLTNSMETTLTEKGQRTVNIDIGYLDYHRLVLASTKESYHRIYMGKGIWAELTLLYQNGGWVALPWTYPDFRQGIYDDTLRQARERYKEQIRKSSEKSGKH
ncbi:MAG: DUF4416 family protein [Candidatus Pacebacteria bacterium]|nr:DUF4416 family protein [Candidatus Paceibacterota bacterium]